MARMAISENEEFPVFGLNAVDPAILVEHPDAGFELDQALIEEFERASAAWAAVQAKLGTLFRERCEFGPGS
jgi:hypothetical protein